MKMLRPISMPRTPLGIGIRIIADEAELEGTVSLGAYIQSLKDTHQPSSFRLCSLLARLLHYISPEFVVSRYNDRSIRFQLVTVISRHPQTSQVRRGFEAKRVDCPILVEMMGLKPEGESGEVH